MFKPELSESSGEEVFKPAYEVFKAFMPDLSDLSGDEVIKADLHEISGDEVFKSDFSEISQDEVSNGKSLKDAVTKADQRLSPEDEGIKSDPCEKREIKMNT